MINWILSNWLELIKGYGLIIALASIIIRLTPTVKDDNFLKRYLRFVGKFIALNRK